jgi:transposase InsO family protein
VPSAGRELERLQILEEKRPQPKRTRLTALQAVVLLKRLHAEVKGAYGSRRMNAELQERGYRIGLCRVGQVMCELNIRARQKRRF